MLLKPSRAYPAGHETLHSSTLGWRMVNPNMPKQWTVSLGETAEILADRYEITRQQQDAFALASHLKALEKETFIDMQKSFVGRKPNTKYFMTDAGKKAFDDHLKALEQLIKHNAKKGK